jgi:ubiquitin carboxyl-terminal hydrolase 9/13
VIIQATTSPSTGASPAKKDAGAQQLTPLEKMLLNAGPVRSDGSDKFFGMENVRDPEHKKPTLICSHPTSSAVWQYVVSI